MKTMSIYEAITRGLSVKNNRSALVSAKNVNIADFANWKVAEDTAFEAFYRYADARRKTARMGEDAVIDKEVTDNAFKALRSILALIGDVNGHKLIANNAMLDDLASATMVEVKDIVGEALTQLSVRDNLKKQVDDIHAGMNPEYVEKITHDYEVARIHYNELCKLEGSCETKTIRAKNNQYRVALETRLALIVNAQDAMSWEALDARDAKIAEDRKNKRRDNKNAKKSAK